MVTFVRYVDSLIRGNVILCISYFSNISSLQRKGGAVWRVEVIGRHRHLLLPGGGNEWSPDLPAKHQTSIGVLKGQGAIALMFYNKLPPTRDTDTWHGKVSAATAWGVKGGPSEGGRRCECTYTLSLPLPATSSASRCLQRKDNCYYMCGMILAVKMW